MLSTPTRLVIAALVLGAAAIALVAIGLRIASYRGPEATKEATARVERRDITVQTRTTGTLRAASEIELKSRAGGPVVRILVDEGDYVKVGDEILRIDDSDVALQLEDARLRFKNASAEYELACSDHWKTEIPRLTSILKIAENELALAEDLYSKVKELYSKGHASERELLECCLSLETAQVKVTMARQELESASLAWPTRESTYLTAVQQAETQLQLARDRVKDCVVRSPVEGYVLSIPLSVGDTVVPAVEGQPGSVLATIGNTEDLIVEMELPAGLVAQTRKGQPVSISYRGFEEPFKGEITMLSHYGDLSTGSPLFPARVRVISPPADVLLGTTVEVAIDLSSATNVLAIPVEAVHDGYVTVITPRGERAETKVKLGVSDGVYVEVKQGLSEEELVVVPSYGSDE